MYIYFPNRLWCLHHMFLLWVLNIIFDAENRFSIILPAAKCSTILITAEDGPSWMRTSCFIILVSYAVTSDLVLRLPVPVNCHYKQKWYVWTSKTLSNI